MPGTAICLLRCDLRAHDNQVGPGRPPPGVPLEVAPLLGGPGSGARRVLPPRAAEALSVFPGAPLGSGQRRFRCSPLLLRPAALPGHPLLRLPEDGPPSAQVFAGKREGSKGNAQEKRKVAEKAQCK